jgi:hypothetical protein
MKSFRGRSFRFGVVIIALPICRTLTDAAAFLTATETKRQRNNGIDIDKRRISFASSLQETSNNKDVVSKSGVPHEESSVLEAIDQAFPPQGLDQRTALSRKDGYWPYIEIGDEPPQELVYGEFDVPCFARILDRACELLQLQEHSNNKDDKVFCDLGSGTGRLVLAAAALHRWKLVRGIELLPGIHDQAEEKLEQCRRFRQQPLQEEASDISSMSSTAESVAISEPQPTQKDYMNQYRRYSPSDDWMNQRSQDLDENENDDTTIMDTDSPQDAGSAAYEYEYALQTPDGLELPLAPIQLTCGSFDDPYEFFGDADIVFVFSTAMPYHVMVNIARAVGRQCPPGCLVITTEYQLPLGGTIEPHPDDPHLPHGDYKLELVETLSGTNSAVGGESTAFVHRVVESLGDGQPRTKPEIPVSKSVFA